VITGRDEVRRHCALMKVGRMKRIVPVLVAILVGVCIGWFFGYTRPVAKNQRKLLKEYQLVRDNFQMTDAEMADFAEHRQEYWDGMKRQNELEAAIAFGALRRLDRGDIEGTRHVLELAISTYFRGHRDDGDTNLLGAIEAFAATNASLSHAIHRKLE